MEDISKVLENLKAVLKIHGYVLSDFEEGFEHATYGFAKNGIKLYLKFKEV